MKVNLENILTSAVGTLVTAIVVGACAIVWKGATTVDEKVNAATEELSIQAEYITDAVDMLENEVMELKRIVKTLSENKPLQTEVEIPTKQFIQKKLPKIGRRK